MTTLLLTARHNADTQALWRAAVQRGWDVERMRGPVLPEGLSGPPYVLYTEALYAPVVAERLGLELLTPPADWLARLPARYTQRWVRLTTLGEARAATEPQFVKPPNDKSFEARVNASGLDLPSDPPDDTPVLIADPVQWTIEFRCFVLDRQVVTMSAYLRHGILLAPEGFTASQEETAAASGFAERLLADRHVELPDAVVLDVGHIAGRGWAAVELNEATSSGIYGCDSDRVLDVLARATQPRGLL